MRNRGLSFSLVALAVLVAAMGLYTQQRSVAPVQAYQATTYSYSVGVQQAPLPNTPSVPMLISRLCGSPTKAVYPLSVEGYATSQSVVFLQVMVSKSTTAINGGTPQTFTPGYVPLADSSTPNTPTATMVLFNTPTHAWSAGQDGPSLERSFSSTDGREFSAHFEGRAQSLVLHGVNECVNMSLAPLSNLASDVMIPYVDLVWKWDER